MINQLISNHEENLANPILEYLSKKDFSSKLVKPSSFKYIWRSDKGDIVVSVAIN